MQRKHSLIIATAVIAIALSLFTSLNSYAVQNNIPVTQNIPSDFAPGSYVPSCDMSVNDIQNALAANSYKVPKYLPTGYLMQDGYTIKGGLFVFYAPSPVCGKDAKIDARHNGVISYTIADMNSGYAGIITQGSQYIQEFKAHSDKPQVISIFEINGKLAMGWDNGTKKDITRWDNGTMIESRDIAYPAQIQVIDKNTGTFYVFKGWTSLEELKKIAQSIV
jgi:hypothetical protein